MPRQPLLSSANDDAPPRAKKEPEKMPLKVKLFFGVALIVLFPLTHQSGADDTPVAAAAEPVAKAVLAEPVAEPATAPREPVWHTVAQAPQSGGAVAWSPRPLPKDREAYGAWVAEKARKAAAARQHAVTATAIRRTSGRGASDWTSAEWDAVLCHGALRALNERGLGGLVPQRNAVFASLMPVWEPLDQSAVGAQWASFRDESADRLVRDVARRCPR